MKTPMPAARFDGAGVAINGKFYVIDGLGSDGLGIKAPYVYDPTADNWSSKSPTTFDRVYVAAAEIGGILYVAGGCVDDPNSGAPSCGSGTTDLLEAYDPSADSWATKSPMSTARFGAAAGAIGGKLYVAGGGVGGGTDRVTVLEVYDPVLNSWTTKAPMPTAREYITGAAIGGKLYVVGGFDGNATSDVLEVYDPLTDTWTTKSSMPTPRLAVGVGVIDGLLHVVGGASASGASDVHEVYDPSNDTWTAAPSMPVGVNVAATDAIGQQLYVAGGRTNSQFVADLQVFTASPKLNCNTSSISGSMEGNLQIAAGSTVQAGYDFTMPGSHPEAHVTFTNSSVTVQVTCPDNSVHPLTISLPTQTYDDPLNSSAWLPSGDQNSSLVYQGSAVSNVCGTQTGHAPQGATFTAEVCSDDAVNSVHVRFHYGDNSAGGWSGTKSVTP